MGRKREISKDQAEVLSGLGHKIHYSYDPSEPVGRGCKKKKRKVLVGGKKEHGKRKSHMIHLTERRLTKVVRRGGRKSLTEVFDSVDKILKAQGGKPLNRTKLAGLVSADTGRTPKAAQVQISHLLTLGNLRQSVNAEN